MSYKTENTANNVGLRVVPKIDITLSEWYIPES